MGDRRKIQSRTNSLCENYDYFSGIEITEEDLEKFPFFYFETTAREYEKKGHFKKNLFKILFIIIYFIISNGKKTSIGKTLEIILYSIRR